VAEASPPTPKGTIWSCPSCSGDARVAFPHVHFAGPGCFAFRVDRLSVQPA
jgi:hypothetical protein